MVKRYIQNFTYVFFGLAVSLIILISKNIFGLNSKYEVFKTLSDGFFIPAVILLCVGLLVYVSNTGFFDIFVYSYQSFKQKIKKGIDKDTNFPKTYYDYKEQKKNKKNNLAKPLVSGCFFLVIAVIFCLLYIYA